MIDSIFNFLRKSIVFGILVVFTFVIVYVPQNFSEKNQNIPEAEAFIGSAAVVAAVTAVGGIITQGLVIKETVLDGIAWVIAKAIVTSMVGSLVNWINSGFEGSPAFVQDLRRNLLEVADRAAGEFIEGLGEIGSFICSPFQLDIQIALAQEYQQITREDKPIETCTLSGIIDNIEDFYEGNFSSGGWENWITITQNPEKYTPYGQLLTAKNAMRIKLAGEQNEKLTEIDWGQGFLSGKICESIEGPSGTKESCSISKPGTTISASLNKALGAGQDQLIAADEMNEIISSLISQLANQAITGVSGLLGLSGGTGYTYAGFDGGSYIDAAVTESGQAVTGTVNASDISVSTFSDSIALHNNIVTISNSYISRLNNYANDTDNPDDRRTEARYLALNVVTTRDKAIDLIPKITTIRDEYSVLEAEKDSPETTIARRREIIQKQAQLYSQFNNLQPYNRTQFDTLVESWRSGLI